ncbi:MAG: dihydroneopterin aldolase [Desulfitobacteriaceae bacterium]
MPEHDVIHMRGLEFYAFHGVLPEERRLGQKFIVDLDLYCDLQTAGLSDRVEDTINYAEVYGIVRGYIESEPSSLLEHLAERMAQGILQGFPCFKIRVELHKPQAPIQGIFRDISIEIWRGTEI